MSLEYLDRSTFERESTALGRAFRPPKLDIEQSNGVLRPHRSSCGLAGVHGVEVFLDERSVRQRPIERRLAKPAHRAFPKPVDRKPASNALTFAFAGHANVDDHPIARSHLIDARCKRCNWCRSCEGCPVRPISKIIDCCVCFVTVGGHMNIMAANCDGHCQFLHRPERDACQLTTSEAPAQEPVVNGRARHPFRDWSPARVRTFDTLGR